MAALMSIWTEPSPSDFDRWERMVAQGDDFVQAAQATGHTASAYRRTNPARHAEIKALWHELQGVEDRRTSRDTLREIATDSDVEAKDRVRAAEQLGKASGYLTDKQQVELSGAAGGPVEVTVEHDDESAARLLAKLVDVGLIEPGPAAAPDPEAD